MFATIHDFTADDRAFADYMDSVGQSLESLKDLLSKRKYNLSGRSLKEVVVQPRVGHISALPILHSINVRTLAAELMGHCLIRGLSAHRAQAYLSIVGGLLRVQGTPYRYVHDEDGNVALHDADLNTKLVWTRRRLETQVDVSSMEDTGRGFSWNSTLSAQRVIDVHCTREFATEFAEFLPR